MNAQTIWNLSCFSSRVHFGRRYSQLHSSLKWLCMVISLKKKKEEEIYGTTQKYKPHSNIKVYIRFVSSERFHSLWQKLIHYSSLIWRIRLYISCNWKLTLKNTEMCSSFDIYNVDIIHNCCVTAAKWFKK